MPLKQGSGQSVGIQTFTNTNWNFSSTNIYHFVMADTEVCEPLKQYSLSWKMLQQYFDQSDIILFNMGLHNSFWRCPKQTTMNILNRVARILQSELTMNPQKQVIFRSTLPQHFPGNDGYYAAAQVPQYKQVGCQKLTTTTRREHETNDLLKFVAEKYKFKYLDSFPIYMDRWDLHWKPTSSVDCTHSCITAEVTVPELALLNSILDWKSGPKLIAAPVCVHIAGGCLALDLLDICVVITERTKSHHHRKIGPWASRWFELIPLAHSSLKMCR